MFHFEISESVSLNFSPLKTRTSSTLAEILYDLKHNYSERLLNLMRFEDVIRDEIFNSVFKQSLLSYQANIAVGNTCIKLT